MQLNLEVNADPDMSEDEAFESKNSSNDGPACLTRGEVLSDKFIINSETHSVANTYHNKLKSMSASTGRGLLATTMKRGLLTATATKGTLIDAMHARMAKKEMVATEEPAEKKSLSPKPHLSTP